MGHDDHDDGMMGRVGLVAHLDEVGRGDPEAEPEVVAVTMSNQARPGQVKLQSKRGKKKIPRELWLKRDGNQAQIFFAVSTTRYSK